MKNTIITIFLIIFQILLISYVVYDLGFKPDEKITEIIKSDTVVIQHTDTVYYPVYKVLSQPDTIYIPKFDTIFRIDTIAVVYDYFSKMQYTDTISGQDAEVIIDEIIHKNRIDSRQVFIKNNRQSVIVTNTVQEKQRNKLFIGGGMSVSKELIMPSVGLKWLKNDRYLIGANYFPFQQGFGVELYYRIK